jgi:ATP-dependent Lon protease
MVYEKQTTTMKKEQSKNLKKRDEKTKKRKSNEHSDSDNSNFSESESENDDMDVHEYRKFLKKIFPSKHLDKKIKAGNDLKKVLDEDEEYDEEDSNSSDEEEEIVNKKNKQNKKTKSAPPIRKSKRIANKKKQIYKEEDEEEEYSDEEESDYEEDDEDDKPNKSSEKVNIIFTIGGSDEYDDEYDDEDSEWEDISNYETENEDDTVSECSSSSESEEESKVISKKKKQNKKSNENKSPEKDKKKPEKSLEVKTEVEEPINEESNEELLQTLKEIYKQNENNKTIKKCIDVFEENMVKKQKKIEKKEKKYKDRNMRIFKKILKDKNIMNDYSFFEKINIDNQKKIIKELKEINRLTRIEKPYRITLLESNIPTLFKGAAMKKINSLRYMEPGSGEYYKIKNWVDTFMNIPFDNYKTLPINISDGVEKCHEFMEQSKNILDSAVYGLNDAKMQIMQMLGQLITNPGALGCAIAIKGPPGTGKTSLVKEGISKILNRPFAFIALGGATDSSFLEGHSYTYEGSTWGKIVQILLDSKCMNPVIYFDELDKISDTPKGEEIAGILTHLTDTSQNSQFHDKYFAEIDFDLSKCLFIFSYNDESKINPILKDRMYRILTKGYNLKQKTIISNNYLLPKIRDQVLFTDKDIIIPDETLHYIIDSYCNKEEGVRNLKRCLEIIYTKLNLYRLMKPGSNLFEQDMSLKVEFPFIVTKNIVEKLITFGKDENPTYLSMYV